MPRVLVEVEGDHSMVTQAARESSRLLSVARRADGFSLVELMMVVTILGILTTIVVFGFAAPLSHVKTVACQSNQRALEGAVASYRIDNQGANPTVPEDLLAYVEHSTAARCPADGSVAYTLDLTDFSIHCALHPR